MNATRWIGADDSSIAVATYDLESLSVLQSPPYLAVGGANGSPWTKRVTNKATRIMRFTGGVTTTYFPTPREGKAAEPVKPVMPCVVTAGVPTRIPEPIDGGCGS